MDRAIPVDLPVLMKELVLDKVTAIWVGLICATGLSWWLGTDGSENIGATAISSVALLVIAFIKVRFVIQYFMDARRAVWPLRLITELYPILVCSAILTIYFTR